MSTSKPTKRRRGHGEGSVYQRQSDKRWVGVVELGFVGTQRKRKTFYRNTRKEAAQAVQDEIARIRQGGLAITPTMRLNVYLDRWLDESIRGKRAQKTIDSYVSIVEKHIVPTLGTRKLASLTQSDVQALIDAKHREGLSARTVEYIRAVLRSALTDALRRGLIQRNVATYAQIPRGERREPIPFTPSDIECLFKAARSMTTEIVTPTGNTTVEGDRFEAAYVIAGTYGLRRGEVLGLRWQDASIEDRLFRVTQQVQRAGGKDVVLPLKTKRSVRSLPLTTAVIAALERRRIHQEIERAAAGDRWRESGLIFTSTAGTPLNGANFYARYKSLLKACGLEDHTFHDLRHTAATTLVAQGVHPRVAMEILGHSNIAVTMDIYSHVLSETVRNVFDGQETES